MQHRIPRASLAPDGFSVDEVKVVADSVQIQLRSRQSLGRCPDCGRVSREFKADMSADLQIFRFLVGAYN